MAMVNMNNLLNGKDSRWLQLEVCREFQRQKCSRPDTECKFAHPPANVEVQNGRVTACYDSIKGRCNREKPPCKYFHPPQHLKDQLLINGRNHLALKNALMQQMGLTPGQPLVPGQVPAVAANPYLSMPQVGSTYSPYFAPGPIMPAIMGPDPTGVASQLSVVPQTVVTQQKMPRSDRLEMDMKSVGSFYYENFAFPGMMPYKRPAADKSGMPVYQPSATTYQQLMQLQQPFVPVSCEYTTPPPSTQQQQQHIYSSTNSTITRMAVSSVQSRSQVTPSSQSVTTEQQTPTSQQLSLPPPQPHIMQSQSGVLLPPLPTQQPPHSVSPVVSAPGTAQENGNTTPDSQSNKGSSLQDEPTVNGVGGENDRTVINSVQITQIVQQQPPPTPIPQPPPPMPPPIGMADAAAIAKEVAQQNYAKKLAQVNNNALVMNPLAALNYTGVALNKQALQTANISTPQPTQPQMQRYAQFQFANQMPQLGLATQTNPTHTQSYHPSMSLGSTVGLAGSPFPNTITAAQQGLLQYSRPPPPTMMPYSLLRQHMPLTANPYGAAAAAAAQHHAAFQQQLINQSFLASHSLPPYTFAAVNTTPGTPITSNPVAAHAAAQAAAQATLSQSNNNNNNIVMQPYKKMKTT